LNKFYIFLGVLADLLLFGHFFVRACFEKARRTNTDVITTFSLEDSTEVEQLEQEASGPTVGEAHTKANSCFTMTTPAKPTKPGLLQSMALGGSAACFAVNFTHPIVR
jgi:hypothetical protein